MEALCGGRAALIEETVRITEVVRGFGHYVGWHHHSNQQIRHDEGAVMGEILEFGPIARSVGFDCFRSGFGQMTNKILACVLDLGFLIDSSCISRQKYPWENVPLRDWDGAPNHPYTPCLEDYKRDCFDSDLQHREVPITTVTLPQSTDTQRDVRRYLNPAYNPILFSTGVTSFGKSCDHNGVLVTITHPFETQTSPDKTFSGSIDAFRENLSQLLEAGFVHTSILSLR